VGFSVRGAAAAIGLLALVCGLTPAARALPPPETPVSTPTATPSPPPGGIAVLPVGSPLYFVLDQPASSNHSRAGDLIPMHLRDPLILNGVTLAAAGAPAILAVVSTRKSGSGDADGALQINVHSLALNGHPDLPLRAIHEYLTIDHTAGNLTTRDATDQVTDIFVPYAFLVNALRKGYEYKLPQGAVLRVLTNATIDARNPNAIAILPPAPLVNGGDVPYADFTPAPLYTPVPLQPKHSPSPRPTVRPAIPSPAPAPSLTAGPTPGVVPSAAQASPVAPATPQVPSPAPTAS
jgi:hypothetical protein